MSNPVIVNFNVEIDADSKLNIFGTAAPTVNNMIVSEVNLPVSALYDLSANKGLIEFWEPDSSENLIYCALADSSLNANYTGAYQYSAKQLAKGLQRLLCGRFDCSNAVPFKDYSNNDVLYYKQRDFGRVALGAIAHDLFGHVDATAAITNDIGFIKSMLSINSDVAASEEHVEANSYVANATSRYEAWTKDVTANVESWSDVQNADDANLAVALVKKIVNKGMNDNTLRPFEEVTNATSSQLAFIANQVLGQDATRMMGYDNSERTKNVRQLLPFAVGDTIYMNIKVAKPSVTVGTVGSSTPAQQTIAQGLKDKGTVHNFTLKIVLTEKYVL